MQAGNLMAKPALYYDSEKVFLRAYSTERMSRAFPDCVFLLLYKKGGEISLWKKINKGISLGIAVLLAIVAVVSGVMAYKMTADEFAALDGPRIDVQLLQEKMDANGSYVELLEGPVLFPMAEGYTESMIRVKNGGNIDTFNRVLIAVPTDLDNSLELVKGDGWTLTKTISEQSCGDEICNIHIFTLDGSLETETVSDPAVLGVRVDAALEQQGDSYILNDVVYDFSEDLQLKITAQAVQSAFLESPANAFERSGMADNPWMPSITINSPVSDTALKAVLRTLPTGTDISASVTRVIFGTRTQYGHIMESCYGQPVDDADPNGPWAYYQASSDDEANTDWTVYILSDDVIYLPEICDNLFLDMKALTTVDTATCDTGFVTSMHGMFQGCSNLTNLDVSDWDMSKVTSTSQMFYQCSKIDNLDVSHWDTSSITGMSQMFNGCSSLSFLDTTNWSMSNVIGSYSYMFSNCRKLTAVDVDGWVTKDTKSISYMFLNCNKLEVIDVSQWDTSNVTSMDNAFNGCSSVGELDVSKWDTSKVTTTWQMFQNCFNVTSLDLTGWNTSRTKNTANMFFNCRSLTELDLSSFDVKNVTKAVGMFNGCGNLTTIYVAADAGWDALATSQAAEVMFASSTKLVGGSGTTYISQDGIYAKVDGGTASPGYFTQK